MGSEDMGTQRTRKKENEFQVAAQEKEDKKTGTVDTRRPAQRQEETLIYTRTARERTHMCSGQRVYNVE